MYASPACRRALKPFPIYLSTFALISIQAINTAALPLDVAIVGGALRIPHASAYVYMLLISISLSIITSPLPVAVSAI